MSFDAIVVILILVFLMISLYTEIVGAAMTFIIAISVLGITQVLTPSEILAGLANEQIAVVIMLLLLGNIYRQTSVLDIFFNFIFRSSKTTRSFTAKMMFIVAPMSAFINNTPLVALMMPYINNRSKQMKESVSKLMIPLSYASILGGSATLIGTSTNLIVNGLVVGQKIIPNIHDINIFHFSYSHIFPKNAGLQMFDFAYIGIPMIFIGIFYVVFIGQKMLPDKKGVINEIPDIKRNYIVEARIKEGSSLIGKTIEEAQLRNLEGLYLYEILRNNMRITAVPEDAILFEEDILLFTGDSNSIAEFVNSANDLEIPSLGIFARKKNTELIEIVISHNSALIKKSLKDINFRAKFDATAIAIHRNGETISGKIGQTKLKAGDAVLLLAGTYFEARIKNTSDFYLISRIKEIRRLGIFKTTFLIAGSIATILFSSLGFIKLFNGLLALLTLLVLLKITRPKDLAKSVDFELGIIIALSLALGVAMMKTGVAEIFASNIMLFFKPFGDIGVLAGIYFITAILAAFITNKAAVAIVFPVAHSLAIDLNIDTMPFILAVAFAASANFMTPIGYQTNLMVYGPGGYKFKDYLKIGTPLTFIYMIVAIFIINYMFF